MTRLGDYSTIQRRLAQLDGSCEDFDPIVSLGDLASGDMQLVRIMSLPRTPQITLLPFIRGLWALQAYWALLVVGRPEGVHFYVGAGVGLVDWASPLESTLYGSQIVPISDGAAVVRQVTCFPFVGLVTGNPFLEREDPTPVHSPIETLARALAGKNWAYVLLGRPLSEQWIRQSLQALHGEHRNIVSNYQRRGSAEEVNHPAAQRLVRLLTAAQQQHELGVQVGMWKLAAGVLAESEVDLGAGAHAISACLARGESAPQPIRCRRAAHEAPCALTLCNSQEVAAYAALPRSELPGLRVVETVRFSLNAPPTHSDRRVACGVLLDQQRRTPNWFEVDCDDLARHAFICGATGSGKSRTTQSMILQLSREFQVPWMVIEPAIKSEYRQLLATECGRNLRVFTVGREDIAPLHLNPLDRQGYVSIDAHIDALVGLFTAAFGLMTPMPFVLRLALQRLYDQVEHPVLPDLQRVVRETISCLGYQGEIGANLHAALDLRLETMVRGVIGQVFSAQGAVSMEELLAGPTVVELAAVGDDATRALMMGSLLLRLVQYRQSQGLSSALRHVTVVEEAHRLLRKPTPRGEIADAGEHATEAFAHLLAEVRAFGQGLMIVDQSPSKLIPDVIRNAQLKIVHRLTASDDQVAVAASMGMDDIQRRGLASLGIGEAVIFSARSTDACRIAVPDPLRPVARSTLPPVGDSEIASLMRPLIVASRRHVPAAACGGCPNDNRCEIGRAIRQHLLTHDESAAIAAAFAQDIAGVRAFGAKVLGDMGMAPSAEAIRCVVLQVARASNASEALIARISERLTAG